MRIRTGSDLILSDQDWTPTEKFCSLLISDNYRMLVHVFLHLIDVKILWG